MTVKEGDKVLVEYEGRLENGEVFDSSSMHGKPIEFIIGEGKLIKGFEDAIIGMEIGEEKEVKLSPEQAYGPRNPNSIYMVPRSKFPEGIMEGMTVGIPMPDGTKIPAMIAEVGESEVKLDLNHPLAGKTLIFKIKLVG